MLKLAAATLAALALAPAAAGAAPAVDGTFDLSGEPDRLALGPDGNVWVTLRSATADVARVTPAGDVTEFDSPEVLNPVGIVASADGRLWVTQNGGVAHFLPADPRAARSVVIAALTSPQSIVSGPDGNLWTASNDTVVRVGTDATSMAFRLAALVGARGIAAGGDGNLYVADFNGGQVVAVTTDGRPAGTFATGGGPQQVAAGPGNQIGYTNQGNVPHQIGRIDPLALAIQPTDVPATDPFGIVLGEDGAYWIANFTSDALTRMTPSGEVSALPGLPARAGARYLTRGAGGTLWVGLETSRQVARVTGVVAPPVPPVPPVLPVPPVGPGRDVTPPVLTGVSSPRSLRVGRRGTLRLTLSEAATVRVRFERRLPGRRKAGRCVKPRRAPQGRRCTRFAAAGTQRREARAGANALSIGGRIGRRVLPVGSYRLTITATDAAGNVSRAVSRPLTVTPPPRRRR